jgi:hypothetical protein
MAPLLRITKIEAARREIEAAIRMTFNGYDAVAIHCVASAASQIVRDLSEHDGKIESLERIKDVIAPGYEKQFWTAFNRSAGFLKHADKEPDGVHTLDEAETDLLIFIAMKLYRDLGNTPSRAMHAFVVWYVLCYPKMLTPEATAVFAGAGVSAELVTRSRLDRLTRPDRLEAGRLVWGAAVGASP